MSFSRPPSHGDWDGEVVRPTAAHLATSFTTVAFQIAVIT